jgi:iron-sulfur cluster assembly protein
MAITLAPAALERVQGFLAETPGAVGLRFGVKRTGCSGWGYVVDLATEQREGDIRFEQDGIVVLVDADSLALVDGTQIAVRASRPTPKRLDPFARLPQGDRSRGTNFRHRPPQRRPTRLTRDRFRGVMHEEALSGGLAVAGRRVRLRPAGR